MKDNNKTIEIIKYSILIFFTFLFIFPILYTVFNTFKPSQELYSSVFSLFPKNWTLDNYIKAVKNSNVVLYFWNTLIVTTLATILTVLINTMAGFALAKYRFPGSYIILFIFISTLAVPLEVIMSPIFIVIKTLGLYDSLWGLIIPAAATPTGVFIMRQYFLSVPNELLESVRIDGGGEWKIFTRIMLPIGKPVVASLSIFSIMWRWNDYLWPLIVLNSPEKYTLQLAISNYAGEFSTDWDSLLAMSVISMIPVLLIFIVFQNYFVKGMASSGMKI